MNKVSTQQGNGDEHKESAKETWEIEAIRRENALLREQTEILKEERQDLRRRLDDEATERRKSAEEIRRLTLLLTYQPERKAETPEPPATKSKLLEKLFGKAKTEK